MRSGLRFEQSHTACKSLEFMFLRCIWIVSTSELKLYFEFGFLFKRHVLRQVAIICGLFSFDFPLCFDAFFFDKNFDAIFTHKRLPCFNLSEVHPRSSNYFKGVM